MLRMDIEGSKEVWKEMKYQKLAERKRLPSMRQSFLRGFSANKRCCFPDRKEFVN
jgi:hypothetical protein